ncbi:hypothetical protein DFR24_3493 [Panacagrimonas perspica]|uniref:DUF484 family protein n=1 Tax=Panacagrimonas perspica TaxID=381431 RepID=A0A4R7NZA1_9GAMM|nr:DUF484 family protein [Panacagrimonas perspica]TDU26468.1 hypothetical protein DFR24_3493 [Panacagrimonas perspica]THD02086.1 hypothetical protein B1810_16530 [Panacagrimonas perspica]
MSATSETAAPISVPALNAEEVAAYLRGNPDFLLRFPELLETLELQHASGSAVSLIERQVEILRGRSQRLEDRLGNLLETARDNERRATSVHRLARSLIRAPTLASAILGLQTSMREDFGIDEVFVGIVGPLLKHTNIEGLVKLEMDGPIARSFDNFFRTKLIECGPLVPVQAKLLFPKAVEPPQSAAVVPLEKEKNLGMLVLGSKDPQRFQPRQGRLFLEMTAELVSAAIRAKLA